MENNYNLLPSELLIDETSREHLKETAKWAKFLAILGFVLCALIIVMAIFGVSMMKNLSQMGGNPEAAAIGGGMLTIIYLILAAIYFFICLYMYKFASKMQMALTSSDQMTLNESFLNLKKLYRMMGIIAIVYLAFIVLALIFGIGALMMNR